MDVASPNVLAVIILAAAYFFGGWLWYSKSVFGEMYMQCCKEAGKEPCGCAAPQIVGYAVIALILSWILGYFVNATGAHSLGEGAKVGFLAWLGFTATPMFSGVLFAHKPLKIFCIRAGYALIAMVIMGAIFGVWH